MAISTSGVYFTNSDIVNIGRKLGYDIDYKSREYVIKTLFTDCENDKKEGELLQELNVIVVKRANELKIFGDKYPHSRDVLSATLQKAKATQMLLQREIATNMNRQIEE
jgi:hypothetical protein